MMCVVLCLIATIASEPSPAVYAGNEELRLYLSEAAEQNPRLQALHAEWLAALARVPQARSLDDPMLGFGYFLQSDAKRFSLRLEQQFPWFGTLRARGEQATAEADAILQRLYAARNRVYANVKQAYHAYSLLGEQIRVVEAQAQVLAYTHDVALSRLSLGMASEDEVLRVSMAKNQLEDRYRQLLDMRPLLSARLNEALGCEVCSERPWPQPLPLPPPAPPMPVVQARLRVANPALLAYEHELAARRTGIELARLMGRPEFSVGLEFMDMKSMRMPSPRKGAAVRMADGLISGMPMNTFGGAMDWYALAANDDVLESRPRARDEISVMINMSLPIWREKVRAGVEEASQRLRAVEHEQRADSLELDTMATGALFEISDARRRMALFKDSLLPQARRVYESLQSQYAVALGDAGFIDLMESIGQLLDFELELLRAETDLHTASAELEFILGGPWAGVETMENPEAAEGE
jgi:outer membrane protein, heavy metal efflux system